MYYIASVTKFEWQDHWHHIILKKFKIKECQKDYKVQIQSRFK